MFLVMMSEPLLPASRSSAPLVSCWTLPVRWALLPSRSLVPSLFLPVCLPQNAPSLQLASDLVCRLLVILVLACVASEGDDTAESPVGREESYKCAVGAEGPPDGAEGAGESVVDCGMDARGGYDVDGIARVLKLLLARANGR
ncbi:hypothetical protein PF010_g19239 [Phytophthora fragariae]|uniref:Uncharacterized protein n=1 Tax=Phytophthora fragariae TaxID=53985 RepID=A0A6A3IAA2_9STRA|nr:hypothetical protein PF011_g22995 [Phytophthora fragariae]KAE9088815.1 hypothetical protein PF010_g19239 [Phytophthora fragariae]